MQTKQFEANQTPNTFKNIFSTIGNFINRTKTLIPLSVAARCLAIPIACFLLPWVKDCMVNTTDIAYMLAIASTPSIVNEDEAVSLLVNIGQTIPYLVLAYFISLSATEITELAAQTGIKPCRIISLVLGKIRNCIFWLSAPALACSLTIHFSYEAYSFLAASSDLPPLFGEKDTNFSLFALLVPVGSIIGAIRVLSPWKSPIARAAHNMRNASIQRWFSVCGLAIIWSVLLPCIGLGVIALVYALATLMSFLIGFLFFLLLVFITLKILSHLVFIIHF